MRYFGSNKRRKIPTANRSKFTNQSVHADGRNYTERRTFYSCRPRLNTFDVGTSLLIVFMCVFVCISDSQFTSCDFSGSGLDLDERGVQPVYLSCAAGRIDWQFPRAALRIVLRYPHSGGEFQGCIKASPEIQGARLFIEGHRSLVPLYSPNDGSPSDMVRCFSSYKGQAALYLEAAPSHGSFKKLQSSFEYDLRPLREGGLVDSWEECRPCTEAELVRLFCSADFAARGTILEMDDDPRLHRTAILFSTSKIFQQTDPIFLFKEDQVFNLKNLIPRRSMGTVGRLFSPLRCSVKPGPGEFIFLGSLRLGEPTLRCAPRLETWRDLMRRVKDSAPCVLQT